MNNARRLAAVAVVGLVAACGGDAGDSSDGTPTVAVSAYPASFLVERVAGDLVELRPLTPAGAEPHDVELGPREVDLIEDADLVVAIGEGFQPALERAAERRDGPTLRLLEGIETRTGEHGDEHGDENGADEHAAVDPHAWLDPRRMGTMAERVADALAEIDPDSADVYAANAAALADDLAVLDAELAAGLETCERRIVVTAHAAFGYLTERYGLRQEAVAGLSPEAEPDPRQLAALADLVRRENVTTVFTEPLASARIARTLAREAGVRTAVLDPLETLTDERRAAGDDYLDVMRHNLAALRDALGCA